MAMIASSAGAVFTSSATASMGPSTGTPSTRRPIFAGSSSRNATTRPKTRFCRSSRASVSPVKPAPTI